MIRGIESILLSSQNAKNLSDFYRDTVGLPMGDEMEIGENGGKAFEFTLSSGSILYISDHSEITGPATDQKRTVLNFEVDNMETEVARLDEKGVKKIKDTYHMGGYGLITTYEDPDGNYFQLVQVREG